MEILRMRISEVLFTAPQGYCKQKIKRLVKLSSHVIHMIEQAGVGVGHLTEHLILPI